MKDQMPDSYQNFEDNFANNVAVNFDPDADPTPQEGDEGAQEEQAESNEAEELQTEDVEPTEDAEQGGDEPEEKESSDGEKSEQTKEERAEHASRARRRKEAYEQQKQALEQKTKQEAELLTALQASGVKASSIDDALAQLQNIQALAAERAKKEAEEAMKAESDSSGIPLEFFQARRDAEDLARQNSTMQELLRQQRAAAVFQADKAAVDSVDPQFFATASKEQQQAFGAMRQAGMDAITAYGYVSKAAASTKQVAKGAGTGTEHMKSTKGRTPGATAIPSDVLKSFKDYGMSDEQARKHYNELSKERK